MPDLQEGDVQIWCISLTSEVAYINGLWSDLSIDEQVRANRFHFQTDRKRYIVSRGMMKRILSRYVDVKPDRLQFKYNYYGKPDLAEDFSQAKLRFNLSHSHELALLAVTRQREIGVDLEHICDATSDKNIPANFFSPKEMASFRGLPPERRREVFYRRWTRKEAYLKATGKGLAVETEFEVPLSSEMLPASLNPHSASQEIKNWVFSDLSLSPDYAGALVVQKSC
jgi:4'-phosphopantetheinyl transferase